LNTTSFGNGTKRRVVPKSREMGYHLMEENILIKDQKE